MKIFRVFLDLELKRFLCKRNITIFLFLLVISCYFLQESITWHQIVEKNRQTFYEIEKIKVKQYTQFTKFAQYGNFEIRLMFIPSILSIFFNNSGHFSNLISNIDPREQLNIYNSFKGKTLFTEKDGTLMNFSGFISLLGSLFALYFGYESFHHKKYLAFLADFSHGQSLKVFLSIIGSRMVIFGLLILGTAGCSWFMLKLNNITLSRNDYRYLLIYMGIFFLILLFFFSLGTIVSNLKTKSTAIISIIGLFFVFIFIIPWTIDKIIGRKSFNMTDSFYLELEKLKIIMDLEKGLYDEYDQPVISQEGEKKSALTTRVTANFWRNDFKKIEEMEEKCEQEMQDNIKNYQSLSMFFPSTFYLSVSNELSSLGYDNFLTFYRYTQDLKSRLVWFHFTKKLYHEHNGNESFMKDGENLFYAHSSLPATFVVGSLLTVFYTILLFITSWLMLLKKVKTNSEFQVPSFELEKGKAYFILSENNNYRDFLFRYYKSAENAVGIECINPGEFDVGISVGEMVTYFCRIKNVAEKKAWGNLEVLGLKQKNMAGLKRKTISCEILKKIYCAISLASEAEVIVVNDFIKSENRKFAEQFQRLLFILQKREKIILYLSTEMFETRLKALFQEAGSNTPIVIDLMSVSLR